MQILDLLRNEVLKIMLYLITPLELHSFLSSEG